MELLFVGSHLGYPMDRTPLGGGAMVGLQLARHWASLGEPRMTALGSGPVPPGPGIRYERIPGPPADIVGLSELGYARFCRRFEAASTEWLRRRAPAPGACVVVNDISEAPDLEAVAAMGYPVLSIWHVDVVDFFCKFYFRGRFDPRSLTGAFERARAWGLDRAVPDVLRLVFDKQRRCVAHSRKMIVPSKAMAERILHCYGGLLASRRELESRIEVLPWGSWSEGQDEHELELQARRLRAHYQIGPDTRVLMTLSRLSPEKGIERLLGALEVLESSGRPGLKDICLLICGEPAFMQGRAYDRKLRARAARLRSTRVFFPGYLDGSRKQAYLRLADLFISPSIHESYGLTVVEALRAGVAVLANGHYGARELIEPDFGRIVDMSSREGSRLLAEELRRLLVEPETLLRMGLRAREAAAGMDFGAVASRIAEMARGCAAEGVIA